MTTALWVGVDAMRAKTSLEAAAIEVTALEGLALAGDLAAIDGAVDSLQAHTRNAHRATSGPHWWLAAHAPVVGPSVAAVRTVATAADDLAIDALPALGQAAAVASPAALAPRDGRVDLQPLIDVAAAVEAADLSVQEAAARLAGIETADVFEQVAAPVRDLRAAVADLAMTTATAARAVALLPPMLGADGPREYLLLAQTNAELRSTGGFVGAVVLLRAEDGKVEIVRQEAGSLVQFPEPILPLTDGELALYKTGVGRYLGNVTATPDFPRAAELARAMWVADFGEDVDGVLAMDPVALQHVLAGTGPVRTQTGKVLTADDAAGYLLNGIYLTVASPAQQDEIFTDAATAVFGALTGGQGDPAAAIRGLGKAAAERRVLVWSAHAEEQERISGTILSGELRGNAGDSPVIGVYLNDGSGAKMSYYLSYSVDVEATSCLPDGAREYRVAVELTSTAPADAAGLPPYLSGGGHYVPVGEVWTNVAVYAPTGGATGAVWVDGERAGVGTAVHDGLDVAARTVKLGPGGSQRIEFVITSGNDHAGPVHLRVTPGAHTPLVTVSDSQCGR